MEETKLNIDGLLDKLSEESTPLDFPTLEYDMADLLIRAYKKGLDTYRTRYWLERDKYINLCVAVCEKLISK